MESNKVFLGVLAGIAAGAVLGILFAPDKGSATRKQIVDKGEGYADTLKHKYNELIDSISKQYGTTKEEVEGLVSKGKTKLNEMKNEHDKAVI